MSTACIYLNDHLAMMTAEVELIGRVHSENEDKTFAQFLDGYRDEVSDQKDDLRSLMERLDCEPSKLKQTVGWLAEKAGRLKLNDSLVQYTSLARVLEGEAMLMAATGRLAFWSTVAHQTKLFQSDHGSLQVWQEQTTGQIEQLRQFHTQAVAILS